MFSSNFLSGGNPLSAMSSAVNKLSLFGDESEAGQDKQQHQQPQQQPGPLKPKAGEQQGNGQPASQGAPKQSRQQPPGGGSGGSGGPQQQRMGRGGPQQPGAGRGGPQKQGAGRGGPQQPGAGRGGSPQQGRGRGGPQGPGAHQAEPAAKVGGKSLCPICKNTELNLKSKEPPNHNTCTQCKSVVCSMCGFSPPDAAAKEWLCLNCQMQRALGGAEPPGPPMMKPPSQPSKAPTPSQPPGKQSPSPAQKKDPPQNKGLPPSANQQTKPTEGQKPPDKISSAAAKQATGAPATPPLQQKPSQQQTAKTNPSPAKPDPSLKAEPHEEQSGFFGFGFGGARSRSPSPQPSASAVSGKVLGFGSSFLSSASNLISSAVQDEPSKSPSSSRKGSSVSQTSINTPPASRKGSEPSKVSSKPPATQKQEEKKPPEQKKQDDIQPTKASVAQAKNPTSSQAPKVNPGIPKALPKACLICKVELKKDPPNYSSCTECKNIVCNQCGFNPTPHQSEGKRWVCLNCQTQQALKGVEPEGPQLMKPKPQPSEATTQKKDPPIDPTQKQSTAQITKTSSANQKVTQKDDTPKQQPSVTGAKQTNHQKPPDQQTAKAVPPPAKSEPSSKEKPPQEESSLFGFGFGGARSRSPSPQPAASAVSGKVLGFGSSLFSSASNLISSAVQDEPSTTPPTSRKGSSVSQSSANATSTPPASRKGSAASAAKETTPSSAAQKEKLNEQKAKEPLSQSKMPQLSSHMPKLEKDALPLPKACPLCKAELKKDPPNYNTCTECKKTVCNLCGFNPMPHQTEVLEWLCLNCQTQRALSDASVGSKKTSGQPVSSGKTGTAPLSQPTSAPVVDPTKKLANPKVGAPQGEDKKVGIAQKLQDQQTKAPNGTPPAHKPQQQETGKSQVEAAKTVKSETQSGFFGFGFGGAQTRPPSPQPAVSAVSGKVLGFGSSFLSSASNLISSAVQDEPSTTPPTSHKGSSVSQTSSKTTPPASRKGSSVSQTSHKPETAAPTPATFQKGTEASQDVKRIPHANQSKPNVDQQTEEKKVQEPQPTKTPLPQAKKLPNSCPLCKTDIKKDPPNYNTCTECKSIVCNLCGFNPVPHQTEVKEWLCLNCQTKRASQASSVPPQSQTKKNPPPSSPQKKDTAAMEAPQKKGGLSNETVKKGQETAAAKQPSDTSAGVDGKQLNATSTQQLNPQQPTSQKDDKPQNQTLKGQPSSAKTENPQESSGFFGFGGARSRSPSPQPPVSAVSGKVLGFGSSLFSSASNLISSAVQDESSTTTPPTSRKGSQVSQSSLKTSTPPSSRKGSAVSQSSLRTTPPPPTSRKGSETSEDAQNKQLQPQPNQDHKQEKTKPVTLQGKEPLKGAESKPEPSKVQAVPKDCPLCKVDLKKDPPNYNTCTQCKSIVCMQCGFNPIPHQTEMKEWLCLNCQMQRASAGPPTPPQASKVPPSVTPQKKEISGPEKDKKPLVDGRPEEKQAAAEKKQPLTVPTTKQAQNQKPEQPQQKKAGVSEPPPKEESGFFSFGFGARSRSPSPQPQPPAVSGKVLGFGSSFLSSASNLISSAVQDVPSTTPPISRKGSTISQTSEKTAPTPPTSRKGSEAPQPPRKLSSTPPAAQKGSSQDSPKMNPKNITKPPTDQNQEVKKPTPTPGPIPKGTAPPSDTNKTSATTQPLPNNCPLCKVEIKKNPPNYNTCTECKNVVCDLCGFNPTPDQTEVKVWLCLNCQVKRASGPPNPAQPQPVKAPPSQPSPPQKEVQAQGPLQKPSQNQESKAAPPEQRSKGDGPAKPTPPQTEPSKEESGLFGFGFGAARSRSPSPQSAASAVSGKVLGFGSSFLSSASNLISTAVQDEPSKTPPTSRKGSSVSQASVKSPTPPASRKASSVSQTSEKTPSVSKEPLKETKPGEKKAVEQATKGPSAQEKKDVSDLPNACPLCKEKIKHVSNFSTCTSCKSVVCNFCGFNPTPEQTGVKEWLCLNCQVQRASEPPPSQPQANKVAPPVSSQKTSDIPQKKPSHPVDATKQDQKPAATVQPVASEKKTNSDSTQQDQALSVAGKPDEYQKPTSPQSAPKPSTANPPPKEEPGFFGLGFGGTRTTSDSASAVSGKVLGFGSSIISSASNLISSAAQDEPCTTPPASRKGSAASQTSAKNAPVPPASSQGSDLQTAPKPTSSEETKTPALLKKEEKKSADKAPNAQSAKAPSAPAKEDENSSKVPRNCPLCKEKFKDEPPNFSTCTSCKATVCNLCGFNPMPHQTDVKQWLCLNCQMKQAPVPHPAQPKPEESKAPPPVPKKDVPAPDPQKDKKPSAPDKAKDKPVSTEPQKPTTPAAQKPSLTQSAPPQKPEPKEEQSGFFGFGFGGARSRSPSPQPAAATAVSGKVLGFGSSLFSSASNLITSAVQDEPSTTPPTSRKGSTISQSSVKTAPTPPSSQKGSVAQKQEEKKVLEDKSKEQVAKAPVSLVKKDAPPLDIPKACPLCKADIKKDPPNYNTCSECKNTVCNLCGFSPVPQTEVKEWLCLNCQMKRAQEPSPAQLQTQAKKFPPPASPQKETPTPGFPEKKPSAQVETTVKDEKPSVAAKPEDKPHPVVESQKSTTVPTTQQPAREGQKEQKPAQPQIAKAVLSLAKSGPKEESGLFGFGFGGARSRSPSPQTVASAVSGKVLGFGSSFLSSASNLISSAVQDEPSTTPPTSRKGSSVSQSSAKNVPTPPASRKGSVAQKQEEKKVPEEQAVKAPVSVEKKGEPLKEPLGNCPLCKVELKKDPPNYNTCTECKNTVCNLCGFIPVPQDTEVRECVTQNMLFLQFCIDFPV
uniref:Zinc finger piccolo-type domain-containing protein n=1 Tax=Astyanax mexicanus TaxID=7994 RepID=A0A8B9JJ45_ASTMX